MVLLFKMAGFGLPRFNEIAMQQPKYKTLYFTLVSCLMEKVIKILQFNELEFSIGLLPLHIAITNELS